MQQIRYILKFSMALGWMIILPTTYINCVQNCTGLVRLFNYWLGSLQSESIYNYAVVLYMLPNLFSALFFIFLPFRRALEYSNSRIVRSFLWWSQPKLYIAQGMYDDTSSFLKYMLFWIVLLICKLAFSYYVEISPLVGLTREVMLLEWGTYEHFSFPYLQQKFGVLITLWAPVVMVYFMDTQVWYSIVSTICGGMIGVIFRLGEVHDLSTFRSRFKAIPRAFSKNLVPRHGSQSNMSEHEVGKNKKHNDEFSDTWNAFIISLREEDLISNRERVLLIVPSSMATAETTVFQWPAFLLAGKIRCAVAMASSSKPSDQEEFMKKIKQDKYTYDAIMECYDTLLNILYDLLVEPNDKKVLDRIRADIENSIRRNSFLKEFRLDELPTLIAMFGKLLDLVKDYGYGVRMKTLVVKQLQDILEGMTRDFMMHGEGILDNGKQLFESINLDSIKGSVWREKCVRLQLLLTIRESTIDVPSNLEARCRILFFANSLFMKMPIAPRVQSMMSFSVLTPYFKEKVLFSEEDLLWKKDEYGLSMLGYLRKIYPDEFQNFLERTNFYPRDEEEIKEKIDEICLWASYRRQTLTRTVRGMMYYRRALEIQCIQDKADLDKFDSDKMIESAREARATADIKFTYIISCQLYGMQEKSMDAEDTIFDPNILNLMTVYPSLRVAYIDEVEVQNANGMKEKTYFSVLVKGRGHKQYEMKGAGHKQYEEIYRIKLPGKPTHIGEGKPEMQNHALIFTRGEALQAIDMNQDNYLEEAFKLRNLLEEFESEKYGKRKPTILGLREHIFTGSVSSLALFMSHQETSFATIGQRVLANPLKVRFHYGHSDIFDRLFHITRGGISKASKTLNIGGGTFSGFNSIMRGGIITHHDYVQVGKGLDVGMNQVSCFEANMANGSGEQTLSRDIYRLGHRFDFYRMLSLYFTTVGFYFSSMVSVLAVYVFLYGRLYLVIRGLDKSVLFHQPTQENVEPLESSLASQSVFQLGFLLVLPILMEFALEIGFPRALRMFIFMQLQLASVFFAFQHGTRTHYYGRTIFYGPATCRPTTHGSAVYHATFAENYRMYSRSHFCKGLELLMLLVVIQLYGSSYHGSSLYRFLTFSIWFMVASWLFAPFIFNPSCFDWQSITEDWIDWRMWIGNKEVLSMSVDQSWETWWKSEQEHLRKTSNHALLEVILSFRFLIYHCGILYYLEIAQPSQSRLIFSLTCLGVLSIVVFLKVDDIWQHRFRTDLQLMFRILKALIFLGSVLMISVLFIVANLNVSDVLVSLLGFILTGWCILLIGQACSPILKKTMLWDSIVELARAYDSMMGFIIFFPIIVLAWFPWVPGLQKRLILTKRSAGPPRSQESTVFGQTLAWEDANQEDVTNEMEELDDQDQSENLVAENNSRKKALIPNLRKTMKHTWSTKIIPRRF